MIDFKKITVIIIFILLSSIIITLIKISIESFDSEIEFTGKKQSKFSLSKDITRKFNVLPEAHFNEINEIFEYKYTPWIDNNGILTYSPSIDFFEGFNSIYSKGIYNRHVPSGTMVFFPENKITVNNDQYFKDKDGNLYFPQPNSIIWLNISLEYIGKNNDLNIVLSTLK